MKYEYFVLNTFMGPIRRAGRNSEKCTIVELNRMAQDGWRATGVIDTYTIDELNRMAQDGWRVTGVIDTYTFLLEREIKEGAI